MSDPGPGPRPADQRRARRPSPILSGHRGAVVIGVATALIVFGLLVITGPIWAPAVAPLFGGATASSEPGLMDRIVQLEGARREDQQKIASMQKTAADGAAMLQQLERQIAALENKPVPAGDVNDLRQQLRNLEAKPAVTPGEASDIRQQLQQLAAANADLIKRIVPLEKSEQAQNVADPTDTALLLTVLQIREATEIARPFAAEYDALATLARTRPDLATAAAPLAEPAKSGVASRAVLMQRLHTLARAIVTAQAPPSDSGWGGQAWARLRGLVTIRRIDGAGQNAQETAVGATERSLTAGDLAGAVAALDPLTGPAAEAARPWLQMARQRLAVEEALRRIEGLLVARLGAAR